MQRILIATVLAPLFFAPGAAEAAIRLKPITYCPVAASYAWHVFREFWPDIKRAIHHPQEREVREWELDGKDREALGRPGED